MRFERRTGWLLVMPAAVVTVLFFVVPLLYFLRFSFERPSRTAFSEPAFTLENFARFFGSGFHVAALTRTLLVAAAATALALLLALPVAYLITKASGRTKAVLIILTVFPLLVGNVVRSIGWVALLGYSGVVNTVLIAVGLLESPVELLRTSATVTVAITSVVLPLMVLTLQASLESVDPTTERAALDLGARPLRVFRQIVLPDRPRDRGGHLTGLRAVLNASRLPGSSVARRCRCWRPSSTARFPPTTTGRSGRAWPPSCW